MVNRTQPWHYDLLLNTINPGLARVSKIKLKKISVFWPNPGPGCLPLESGRGDVEFASVFASVACLAVSLLCPNAYFGTL